MALLQEGLESDVAQKAAVAAQLQESLDSLRGQHDALAQQVFGVPLAEMVKVMLHVEPDHTPSSF